MMFIITSCVDDILIDTQEGPQLIGISGYISNEYKKHQIVISKTMDFYSNEEIEMISDAEVFVFDGNDTIYFKETDNKGYYETIDSIAGTIGRTYKLHVNLIDEDGEHYYYAESTMKDNATQIDSMTIKGITLGEWQLETLGIYPYFQSISDMDAVYLVNASINDSLCNKSLIDCQLFFLGGLSGEYVNGQEMVTLIGEQPLYIFPMTENSSSLPKHGDIVTMILYSITPEFSQYISDINSNFGSNPMMGMPYNVSTNIYPEGKAVGFFEAYSVIESSVIY